MDHKGNAYRIWNYTEFRELDDRYVNPTYLFDLETDESYVSVPLPRTAIKSIINRMADHGLPVVIQIEEVIEGMSHDVPVIFEIRTDGCSDEYWDEIGKEEL